MPTVQGTVSEIDVFEEYAWVKIEDSGDTETVFIWSNYAADYSPQQRLVHGAWLSLLREALVNRLQVSVYHPSDSSMMSSLDLYS